MLEHVLNTEKSNNPSRKFIEHVSSRRYLTGEAEEPRWELRMSITFSALLSIIVVSAILLATRGIYPK
jgi:hypothetical protein